jgi:hypothetical protein
VGKPVYVADNTGDTWCPAWTPGGDIFSPSNDTKGFHLAGKGNLMFNRIIGDKAAKLTGETVNAMAEYGDHAEEGPDVCSWKTGGCASIDGALYLLVGRHKYGEKSGDATRRQTAQNTSFIRSTDDGKSWVRSASENYARPMFPGLRFGAPFFVNYGQDGREAAADGNDHFIYAISNNGFWDNGDDMVLGRVLRSKMAQLRGKDWEFFRGGDGAVDSAWSSKMEDAKIILSNPNHLGSTGATYLPKQKCYLMISWYYPMGGGKVPGASVETRWDFYVARHPWGPWKTVGSHAFKPEGFYCPAICPKFTSKDGSKVWALTAGDWNNEAVYRLTAVPLTLS